MDINCPICGQGQIARETWQQEFDYKGALLTAERTEEFCNTCGTLLQSLETCRQNVRNKRLAEAAADQVSR